MPSCHTVVWNFEEWVIGDGIVYGNIVRSVMNTSSFARSATSPSFAYMSNPVPDSSLCRASCSPIASASAASPRLHRSFPASSPRLHRSASWLLFPVSIRFSCSSPLACLRFGCSSPISTAPRSCVRFGCCSPISTAPRLRSLQLLLPDCVRFNCSSPIACT